MPELLHPGVYVQEVSSGVRPIEGVSTSTAAFIGVTTKGPLPGTKLPAGRVAQPVLVTSFTDYLRQFGGFRRDSFLTYAVRSFYDNGGRRVYIVRVATTALSAALPAAAALPVSAATHGAWGNDIWVSLEASSDGVTGNFKLIVMTGTTETEAARSIVETYDNVTFQPGAAGPAPANYVKTLVNGRSEFIAFTGDLLAAPAPIPLPPARLTGGSDGVAVTPAAHVGEAADNNTLTGTGLFALDKITDVNIIAIPGVGDAATASAAMAYCKNVRPLQDCFYIADVGSIASVEAARLEGASTDVRTIAEARTFAVTSITDKSVGDYGAIYFPWLLAADPIGAGNNPRILLPPSGFMAGIYARTDNSRGVFKAPAGTEAGVAGALAPFTDVSDFEQDTLNPVKVNVIRTVPAAGLVVWGTRTIGSDAEWRYIPVRRTAIFLRVSIYNGIQFAVFEPNDEPLWASLRLNIRAFMMTQFRSGAFQGSKPDEAFFVKCDSTTTTQTDIDNGVVNILVGFAPLKPAEFVVLKLSQKVQAPA